MKPVMLTFGPGLPAVSFISDEVVLSLDLKQHMATQDKVGFVTKCNVPLRPARKTYKPTSTRRYFP